MNTAWQHTAISGVCASSSYPYTGVDGICQQGCTPIAFTTGAGYADIGTTDSDMQSAVLAGPVSIAVEASGVLLCFVA
jgi:hypothetical protein